MQSLFYYSFLLLSTVSVSWHSLLYLYLSWCLKKNKSIISPSIILSSDEIAAIVEVAT